MNHSLYDNQYLLLILSNYLKEWIDKNHDLTRFVDDDIYYFQLENLHPGYRLTYRGRILEALVTSNRSADLNQLMPKKKAPDLSKFLLSPMPGLLI